MPNLEYNGVVIGSGPNGLAAAVTLARAGWRMLVMEAEDQPGGGARSAMLTLPGFLHDTCSAIHPMAIGSPCFADLPLMQHGLSWIHPPVPLAHPLDDGSAVILRRSIAETADDLRQDAQSYSRCFGPLSSQWPELIPDLLGPLRWPRHPVSQLRFGKLALLSADRLARNCFSGMRARALWAGLAAHAIMDLREPATSAVGLVLGAAGHAVGWPLPQGGSQRITDALIGCLRAAGGDVITGTRVTSLNDLPTSNVILADISPRQLDQLAGHRFPARYRRALARYRYGPGIFKIDYALSSPVPWTASHCRQAGTIHLGGTFEEIRDSEAAVGRGEHPTKPFVLAAQPSLFDPSRAPAGAHTFWVYCHVPNGSTQDMTHAIEAQIERFAPGFRDCVLARHVMDTRDVERHNANYVGGDINCGALDLGQLFTRPAVRLNPYTTPVRNLFICSAATPPGGGVHGMCGYHAAQAALRMR